MQSLIGELSSTIVDAPSFIFKMLPSPLSGVPFHKNTKAITRYFSNDLPLHLAVHEVSPVQLPPPAYTEPHVHEDHDELNIIISHEKLLYRIRLGEEEYTVSNNACIWIPRGMLHAANVLEGSGFYIAMRLD